MSQALYVAAKLGLPDQLFDGPRPVEDVAATLAVDPDALRRLARVCAGLGVLTEAEPGSFGLTPLGRTLTSDEPGSMRDLALMWMETHYAPFGGLLETVRTGRSAAESFYGMPFFEWLGGHPDQVERFTGAMANLTDGIKSAAIAQYDFGDLHRVADLGGADGTLLAHLLAKTPGATGVSLDLPHVVPAVAAVAKEAGLEDRLTGMAGDFFAEVPRGFDTYVMSMVLHDWDDEHARRILSNIATAGAPGAQVIAMELVLPPGDQPHMAKMIDLTMLGMLDGRERSEPELRALMESAGLDYVGTQGTPTPLSFVRGVVR